MNFIGGVIIIGSLLWDENPARVTWRKNYLTDVESRISVPLQIRYGRKSASRQGTYTMLFCNHPETEFGSGYIIGFNKVIDNFATLADQAFALSKAEGISKNDSTLNGNWGTVALLINPNIDSKDKVYADEIRNRWSTIYLNYRNNFKAEEYSVYTDTNIIDSNGFLKLKWTSEMDSFDFLIATPVIPNIKRILSSKEIADKMIEQNYFEYFLNNISNGIDTFQDQQILELIRK